MEARYRAVRGYSVPVVRVYSQGQVACTLSFTADGKPINPPTMVSKAELAKAWQEWLN